MASWQMRVLGVFLRAVRKRRYATAAAGRARLTDPKGSSDPPPKLTETRTAERYDVDGFPVVVVHPDGGAAEGAGVTVYLHGGAYVSEIVTQHWELVGRLADRTGRPVHVPLYGLAPDHVAAEAVAFARGVVAKLAASGARVHLAGDSAGGGLALLVAQQADGVERACLVGVSVMAPWLDLAVANPEIPAVERDDPWLSAAGLRPIAAAWADGVALQDPAVSPLFGDLSALPPVAVWVGTRDITLPDCRLLRDRLAGTPGFRYTELEGAVHVYPLLPVPEGRRARAEIADHIAGTLTE